MQSLIAGFKWLFTKTLPAGRLFGIPLRVHLLIVILTPFIGLSYYAAAQQSLGPLGGLAYALMFVGVLYGSVLAHEFGHAWGTRLVGGENEQIILTPVGGVAMGTGSLQSPKTELLVVALGPAVSVILAVVFGVAAWLIRTYASLEVGRSFAQTAVVWIYHFVSLMARINLMLTLFNLLFPLFPMDSGRLIRAGFSLKYVPEQVTLAVTKLGIVLGVVLLIFFFLPLPPLPLLGPVGPFLSVIGLLGIFACLGERQRLQHMEVYTRGDNWGGRRIWYDTEVMETAKSRAEEDIRGALRLRSFRLPGLPRRKVVTKRSGPAKVINIAPPAPLDPDELDSIEEIRAIMREAANREDFKLAARCKARIREIEAADASGSSS